ncbi:hypothetical protein HHI36_008259 [Cryptolaemus montrouzieri]|uniref:Uncharacterized protein n=1 Tax=Cryptolaemus montrouzieri TaxID=559131 RepID=A0ABD2MRZ3_9CUCU
MATEITMKAGMENGRIVIVSLQKLSYTWHSLLRGIIDKGYGAADVQQPRDLDRGIEGALGNYGAEGEGVQRGSGGSDRENVGERRR